MAKGRRKGRRSRKLPPRDPKTGRFVKKGSGHKTRRRRRKKTLNLGIVKVEY